MKEDLDMVALNINHSKTILSLMRCERKWELFCTLLGSNGVTDAEWRMRGEALLKELDKELLKDEDITRDFILHGGVSNERKNSQANG